MRASPEQLRPPACLAGIPGSGPPRRSSRRVSHAITLRPRACRLGGIHDRAPLGSRCRRRPSAKPFRIARVQGDVMRSIPRSIFTALTAAMGLSLAACAAAPPPAAHAPVPPGDARAATPPPPPLPESEAFAVHGTLKDEWLPLLKPTPFDP